jgi:hypothetical protein
MDMLITVVNDDHILVTLNLLMCFHGFNVSRLVLSKDMHVKLEGI